jgi:hypothetical protein
LGGVINWMADFGRLFEQSLTGLNPYEGRLARRFEFSDSYTFAENKAAPVFNWFYYKEGYSGGFVSAALKELGVPAGSLVVDPFCGAGTTLLAAKRGGFPSAGFDILPLGVFVSRVKLEEYDVGALEEAVRRVISAKFRPPATKLTDIRFMDMRKVFTPYARDDIAFFRERILEVDDVKARDFLMLALISVVSQASNVMKDGGVLRIVKKRHVPPVKHLFRSKLKRMLRDVRSVPASPGVPWSADVGDARCLPLGDGCASAVVSSPPYLNFVDYTKVYALELGLLVGSAGEMEGMRRRSLRSHISAEYSGKSADDVKDVLGRVTKIDEGGKNPQVVEGYLQDMYLVLKESARVLEAGGRAVFVVGNASLPNLTVDVDLILAELGERLGFAVDDIWVGNVRWADVHGLVKQRPARESAVVLRKGG